jgi:ATP-dependent exoDNAse (exonuclease V) beta subunit
MEPDTSGHARVADARDRTVGTLVHRLFQFPDCAGSADEAAHARALLRPEERSALEDVDATVAAALEAWRTMRRRDDVVALLASGRCLYEVPFSMRLPEDPARVGASAAGNDAAAGTTILRGTIDCLVVGDDGSVVVVELKTGRPRAAHQRQLDLYVEAARALFPAAAVSGRLLTL